MLSFSEYVSLGHPDKIADYISQYILDRYIEQDPATRYAVEVQIKDNHVTLGGEIASKIRFSSEQISQFVREAVNDIGYTKAYQDKWGIENTICGESLSVVSHIGQQSTDIARGLDGWGDQGIFFGMATPHAEIYGMPYDHNLAKRLCKDLFESGLGGLDIKTQIVIENDVLRKVIVAIPLVPELGTPSERQIEEFVRSRITLPNDCELIVNGTGRYISHGSIADCGTTGRKLAVDFYGGNCRIGGGSPWTKDGSKADLTLNLMARKIAREYAKNIDKTVYSRLACCIGRQEIDFSIIDEDGKIIDEGVKVIIPSEVIKFFHLNTPIFASMCCWGLFGEFQKDKIWEK